AAAQSLEHALTLKAEAGEEARFLAGGQSLIPAMNFRLAQPAMLIDLNPLDELDYIRVENGVMRIGARTRYSKVEHAAEVARWQPLLAEVLPNIAHPQIRNRGTLCGNLAHADPASELPAVMLACGARMHARSAAGERWIPAAAFFLNLFETALTPDEMLVEIELPALPERSGTAFIEVARRPGDYAMAGVAVSLSLDANGLCSAASIALCNAGPTPLAASIAAKMLIGSDLGSEAIAAAAAQAQREVEPNGNVHCTADYQRHLAGVLTRRALTTAAARARTGIPA
ncbi:MAG TPA: xanthine dehydrogenase family protein subunit M, partial [Burkholderiales bacterium]|nr:xanthine dehydrogenase family protein subunit M [Burkholderiales bacterium]